MEKTAIEDEIKDRFNHLVSALNRKDAGAWSGYYSREQFVSAIAGTDYYEARTAWVDSITNYFSMRESQHVNPVAVRVTALTSDMALMTSEEMSEMQMKNGDHIKSKHVFTMIWKKEQDRWNILHSHESWLDDPAG